MRLGMMDDTQKGRQTKGKFKIPWDHPQLYRQMKISTLGHKTTLTETHTKKARLLPTEYLQAFNVVYRECMSFTEDKEKKSECKNPALLRAATESTAPERKLCLNLL